MNFKQSIMEDLYLNTIYVVKDELKYMYLIMLKKKQRNLYSHKFFLQLKKFYRNFPTNDHIRLFTYTI